MIPCKHCNTHNSLDSTFCKRCGTSLPEEQLAEAREKLLKIIDEGFVALEHNRLEEASAIAESAVVTDPSNTRALSLKASCHERRGEIAEALECAERIVELNPNSELDKIKRNQLRSALAASRSGPAPGRFIAGLAAASAAVLVLCVGLVVSRKPEKGPDAGRVALNDPAPQNPLLPRSDAVTTDPTQVRSAAPQTSAPQQQQFQQPAQADPPSDGGDQYYEPQRPTRRSNSGSSLPGVGDGTDPTPNIQIEPLHPDVPKTDTPKSSGSKSDGGQGGDPAPPAVDNGAGPSTPAPVDPGQIDIRPHSGASQRIRGSGSETVPSAVPADQASRVYSTQANSLYQIGSYAGAATALEKALQTGGDPVNLNYRLGQCYQNLGRVGEASAAFQHAVDAARSAIGSGHGSTRIQAILETSQAALSQLHGGT